MLAGTGHTETVVRRYVCEGVLSGHHVGRNVSDTVYTGMAAHLCEFARERLGNSGRRMLLYSGHTGTAARRYEVECGLLGVPVW